MPTDLVDLGFRYHHGMAILNFGFGCLVVCAGKKPDQVSHDLLWPWEPNEWICLSTSNLILLSELPNLVEEWRPRLDSAQAAFNWMSTLEERRRTSFPFVVAAAIVGEAELAKIELERLEERVRESGYPSDQDEYCRVYREVRPLLSNPVHVQNWIDDRTRQYD